jgi:hypothetical protein
MGIKSRADHVDGLFLLPIIVQVFCKRSSKVPKKSHHEQTSVQSWQVEIILCLFIFECHYLLRIVYH